ncbi:MAG: hypothetical protein ACPGVD_02650 [Flavobacteriales bacterium]
MKYFVTTHSHNFFLVVFLVLVGFKSSAQETGISPYSRIGLGDLNFRHSPAFQSLGGSSVSLSDFNLLNLSNPASFSSLTPHMPVFEIDGATQFLKLTAGSTSANLATTSFTRMSIGIPVNEKLGLAFGVLPYTTTGYDITTINSEPSIGDVTYKFKGKGGINKLFLGGGYDVYSTDSINLSVGLSAGFLFGNIEKSRRVEFPDDNSALNSLLSQQTGYNGFSFELGLLYSQYVTEKFSYSLGASFTTGVSLNANRTDFFGTYTNFSSVEVVRDTLSYSDGNEGTVEIPSLLRLGGSIKLNGNFEISAQYQSQDWSKYSEVFNNSSVSDTLSSSSFYSLGMRYRPTDVFSTANIFERIEYRAGIRYGNSSLQFNNTQLTEFGTSFGLGIPLRKSATSKNEFRSLSMLNVGVEFGNRGTTDNGLIKENFTTIYFGISIMPQVQNRWFVKRKFK